VPKAVINAYVNPTWDAYNKGLTRLVQTGCDVKIAKGCGHFIQKDDPAFVAREISDILNELQSRRAEGAPK
jgi:pimeloyl-ACP methyl ester carboxylesterase